MIPSANEIHYCYLSFVEHKLCTQFCTQTTKNMKDDMVHASGLNNLYQAQHAILL